MHVLAELTINSAYGPNGQSNIGKPELPAPHKTLCIIRGVSPVCVVVEPLTMHKYGMVPYDAVVNAVYWDMRYYGEPVESADIDCGAGKAAIEKCIELDREHWPNCYHKTQETK